MNEQPIAGSRKKKASRLAMALEPRMMFDAAAVATAAEIAVQVAATDVAPGVEASGANAALSIQEGAGAQQVDLFNNVKVTQDGSGQALENLVVTVNRSGDNQALVIDGTDIKLTAGQGVTQGTGQYAYTVSVTGGVTSITLSIVSSLTGADTASVETAIDNMAYKTLDASVESGSVSVKLASLSDAGGETAQLDIAATVDVKSSINAAPVLDGDVGLEPRETLTQDDLSFSSSEVAYSSDGRFAYVAGNGVVQVYSVDTTTGALTLSDRVEHDDLTYLTHLVVSKDGKSVYAIAPSQQMYGSGMVVQLTADGEGHLSYTATTTTNGWGNFTGGLAISDDGLSLYAGTGLDGLMLFSRNPDTGALTFQKYAAPDLPRDGDAAAVRNGHIIMAGNLAYGIYSGTTNWGGSHRLVVFERDPATGILKNLNDGIDIRSSEAFDGANAVDYALAVSQDGQFLFIGHPGDGTIAVYQYKDGVLGKVAGVELPDVGSLALSSDGTRLYAAAEDGLHVYGVDENGSLTALYRLDGVVSGSDISVAQDGSVLVAGGGLVRYSAEKVLEQGKPGVFAGGLNLRDVELGLLGNYVGASITLGDSVGNGSFGLQEGSGLTLADGKISIDGKVVAELTGQAGAATIRFTGEVSAEQANQVLSQLTYRNDTATAGSTVVLTITANDGSKDSNAVQVVMIVNSVPQINTEVAQDFALAPAIMETAYSVQLPAGLFTDADRLTWSVTGLPDGLVFDPATLTISGTAAVVGKFPLTVTVKDVYGASQSLVVELSAEQLDNRAPEVSGEAAASLPSVVAGSSYDLTLDAGMFSDPDAAYGDTLTWSVSGLPAGMSFDSVTLKLSGAPAQQGDYQIRIVATDTAGLAAEHTMTLRVISQSESDNSAPVLGVDASDLVYKDGGTLGDFPYYVFDMALSPDGKTLVVIGNDSGNAAINSSRDGISIVNVYSRDTATGKLTLLQSFKEGESDVFNNGLNAASAVSYSPDGRYAFILGMNATRQSVISTFTVDVDGKLSNAAIRTTGTGMPANESAKELVVSHDGKTIYVVSTNTVRALSIADNGYVSRPASGNSVQLGEGYAIDIDASGTIYALGERSVTIIATQNTTNLSVIGTLTRARNADNPELIELIYTNAAGVAQTVGEIPSLQALSDARGLAVSSDGEIYITTVGGDGGYLLSLKYDAAADSMALLDVNRVKTGDLGATPFGVELSKDGTALYVGGGDGGKLAIYTLGADGKPTLSQTLDIGTRAGRILEADGWLYTGGVYNSTGVSLVEASAGIRLDYSEGTELPVAGEVSLRDADYDALNGGAGNYQGAVLVLERAGGANAADGYGFISGNGLERQGDKILLNGQEVATFVEQGGKLTLTFTGASVSTEVANQVLHQISYANRQSLAENSLTLELRVQDEYASGVAVLAVTLDVVHTNTAPVVEQGGGQAGHEVAQEWADGEIPGLSGTVSSVLSADGTTLYVVDSKSAIAMFSRDTATGKLTYVNTFTGFGLENLQHLQVSADGKDVYAYGTIFNKQWSFEDTYVVWFQRGDDGVLTLQAKIDLAYPAMLSDVGEFALSDDGKNLYVRTGTALGIFSRDTATGQLTHVGNLSGELWSEPYFWQASDFEVRGDLVYVTTGRDESSLIVYRRDASGALSLAGFAYSSVKDSAGQDVLLTNLQQLAVSPDGSTVYVRNSQNQIDVFQFDATSGSLTHAGQIAAGTAGIQDLAVSADGSTLYVLQDDGTLQYYAASGLQAVASVAGLNGMKEIVVAANGDLLLRGDGVSALSVPTVPVPVYTVGGTPLQPFDGLVLRDAEMDAAANGNGHYNGASLTITGPQGSVFGFAGEAGYALGTDGSITLDGKLVATLQQADGQLTLRFQEGATTAMAQAVIKQVTYAWQGSGTPDAVSLSVVLSDPQGLASAAVAVALEVVRINTAPVVEVNEPLPTGFETLQEWAADGIPGLTDVVSSVVSADGKTVYAVDSKSAIAMFSRDTASGTLTYVGTFTGFGLENLQHLQVSADGKDIYAYGTKFNAEWSFDDTYLVWIQRGDDGTLTLQATTDLAYPAMLSGVAEFVLSDDGKNLYVRTEAAFGIFSRDATTGQLTHVGNLSGDLWSAPYFWQASDLEVRGDLVYATTGREESSLIVYRRDASGTLSLVTFAYSSVKDAAGQDVALTNLRQVTVSPDGSTIYVRNSQNQVDVFHFDVASGTLAHTGQLAAGTAGIQDMKVSVDGRLLYVLQDDGSLQYYDAASLASAGTVTGLDGVTSLAIASNGDLILRGDGLAFMRQLAAAVPVHTIGADPALPFTDIVLKDAELDDIGTGGNYQGARVVITGPAGSVFGFAGQSGYSLGADGNVVFDGAVVATFEQRDGVLTLAFQEGVSSAMAHAMLGQISYAWQGSEAPAAANLSVVFNDGTADSAAVSVSLALNHAPVADDSSLDLGKTIVGREIAPVVLPASLVSDLDGDGLVWAVAGLPEGMSFDAATRTLSGTPTQAWAGPLRVTVSDPHGASVTLELAFTVAENVAPVDVPDVDFSLPSTQVGGVVEVSLPQGMFADADSDALTISVAGLPAGLVFDPVSGKISGTVESAGRFVVTVTATDPSGATAAREVLLDIANVAPTVEAQPISSNYTEQDTSVPVFRDVVVDLHGSAETVAEIVLSLENIADIGKEMLIVDGTTIILRAGESGQTLGGHAYTVVQDGAALTLTLTAGQAGLQASAAQALLAGVSYANTSERPSADVPRTITLVSLRDSGGVAGGGADSAVVNVQAVVTVEAVNGVPELVDTVPVLTARQDQPFSYTLPAGLFVDPDGDALTLQVDGLPAGWVFDARTRTITATPGAADIGAHVLVVTASDGRGATAAVEVTVQVSAAATPDAGGGSDSAVAVPLSQLQPDTTWMHAGEATASQGPMHDTGSDLLRRLQGNLFDGQAALGGNASGRPLGYAPLGAAGVAGLDLGADLSGTRGLPFYINGALSWQERAAADLQSVAAQRASVQDSSLHGRDAQRAHAVRDAIHGAAQWDAAHGRYEYQLSDKLFQGKQAIVAIVLARPDGSPAPDGVTLDKQSGRIAVQGVAGTLNLVLIAQTRDGRELLVPVVLEVPADAARPQVQAGQADAAGMALAEVEAGKPAVSQQISAGASLAQQAEALLARLTQQG